MLEKLLIVIVVFICITGIFHRAAGGLSPKRLNLISVTYYIYSIMIFLGTSLAYLGLVGNHYLIARLSNPVIEFTFAVVSLSGLGLGLIFAAVNLLFGNHSPSEKNRSYYESSAVLGIEETRIYSYVVLLSVISTICVIYTFYTMGTIPLIDVLLGHSSNAANARWSAKNTFSGVVYIRNIGMLMLSPICNFMAFAGWRITGGKRWRNLFLLTAIVCAISLSYDLEKSPIINHVIYLFILACIIGYKPSNLHIIFLVIVCAMMMVVAYSITTNNAVELNLVSGPIGRTIVTPAAALGLHFLYFPNAYPFLEGSSLPTYWATFLGIDHSWVRSAQVVMQIANPSGVANNTAGVMNAFFVGEAYANWGINGIVVSVVLVGVILGAFHNLILSSRKTFFTVIAYLIIIKINWTSFNGGFIDYFNYVTYLPLLIVLLPLLFREGGAKERSHNSRHITRQEEAVVPIEASVGAHRGGRK